MLYMINVNKLMIPSLALATLKTLLKKELVEEYEFKDIDITSSNHFEDYLKNTQDDQIYCFTVSSYNIKDVLDYTKILRKEKPRACIILGGPMVSSKRYSLQILENHPEIDYIVRGRSDETFPKLVKKLKKHGWNEKNDLKIPNLTYLLDNKPYASEDKREDNPNFIDFSPWLSEADYLLNDYFKHARGALPYNTGYGCPNKCTYCVESHLQLQMYPIERVKEELSIILDSKPKSIFLFDSTIGYTKKRAMELMQFISEKNKGTRIGVYININHLDEEFSKLAKKANVYLEGVGVQTIHDKTCSTIQRPKQNPGELRGKINSDFFQNNTNDVWIGMIYGLPKEGFKEFRENLDFGLSLRSNHHLGLYRYCYYPGTLLYETELGYKSRSETDPEIVSGPDITEEEVRKCNLLSATHWIMFNTFPFSLMALTHLDDWDRSGVLEHLAEKIKEEVSEDMVDAMEDVAFANKSDESRNNLVPVMDEISSNPEKYSIIIKKAFVKSSPGYTLERLDLKWMRLDNSARNVFFWRLRLLLENKKRLESLINGILGKQNAENNIFFYTLGSLMTRSKTFDNIIYLFTLIQVAKLKIFKKTLKIGITVGRIILRRKKR